jgi:thiol reductant ABC exporter CydC subunit
MAGFRGRPLVRALALARPVRGWLALAAAASFGALAANLALMAVAPYLISKAALVTEFASIAVAVTAVRTFAVSRAVLRYLDRYVTHLAALRILARLRVWLFRAVEPLAPGGLAGFRRGDVMARALADLDALDEFYARGVVPPVAGAVAGGLACLSLALLDWRLAPALLVFLVLAGVALPLIVQRGSRRPAKVLAQARGRLHAAVAEDVAGLADLIAFGRQDEIAARVEGFSRPIGAAQRRLASARGADLGVGAALTGLAGLTLLALAVPEVRGGRIAGVLLAAVPLVAFAAFEGVLALGDAFRQAEISRAAAARSLELVDTPRPVTDPARPLPVPSSHGVGFRDVRFRYRPDAPLVLDGISFQVPPGQRLGIAGHSGAGKTTLVGLLLRFWEAESGAVEVGRCDVRNLRAEAVRGLIGVVPQRIYLFNGTLRDNLLLADGDADDDRILEACGRAQLGDLVAALPERLDTRVGEDGLKLSGGERQRVALARVFLREAPILILDEATANLDAATERRVLRAVDDFASRRTTIVISHRPAPLELAELVVGLPDGVIRLSETPGGR